MNNGLNLKQKLVVIGMDLLLLMELTCCIFWGHPHGEAMAGIFLRTFIPSALLTVVVARVLIRKLNSPEALAGE